MSLDEYINLRSRVEDKMRIAVMSSTGHGNPLEQGDSEDTQYRTEQLRRLQEEAADLEDMTGGISITDIGLNEFRTDLMSYVNRHPDIERVPPGIHAVVHGDRPGVIFILKNTGRQDSLKSRSRLYPYYAVYVGTDGKVITDSLNPRSALDIMRRLSRGPGKNSPDKSLCAYFNKATKDGKDMHRISRLLDAAVMSVIDAKAEDDINSLFTEGSTTFLAEGFSGLQDFELICFLAVV